MGFSCLFLLFWFLPSFHLRKMNKLTEEQLWQDYLSEHWSTPSRNTVSATTCKSVLKVFLFFSTGMNMTLFFTLNEWKTQSRSFTVNSLGTFVFLNADIAHFSTNAANVLIIYCYIIICSNLKCMYCHII